MTQDIPVTTNEKSNRIRAFDIIRGYFLIVILINHIELYPSFFDFFTGRGRLLVSAAEGFFFMAGLLVGIVYKRRLHLGMKFILKKMWRRAWLLYIASVGFTLLFTLLALHFNHPNIKQGLTQNQGWLSIVGQTLLMHYSFGWADFLYRFALLMLAAPGAFYLLNKGKWWLVALISVVLWALPGDGNPMDILNWQIIFMMGMIGGFYWTEIHHWFQHLKPTNRKRLKLGIASVALTTFTLSYASVFLLSKLNQRLLGNPQSLSPWWQSLTLHWNSANEYVWLYAQKWTMGPLRIMLFAIWFLFLFMAVRRYEHTITRYTKGVVETLGRNSLFVYIAHAFIVFAFKLFIPNNTNIFQNFIITASALALLVVITYNYVDFTARKKRLKELQKSAGNKYYSKTETAKN